MNVAAFLEDLADAGAAVAPELAAAGDDELAIALLALEAAAQAFRSELANRSIDPTARKAAIDAATQAAIWARFGA